MQKYVVVTDGSQSGLSAVRNRLVGVERANPTGAAGLRLSTQSTSHSRPVYPHMRLPIVQGKAEAPASQALP
jgi:hypothetical protein